jgi:hypothetical protein
MYRVLKADVTDIATPYDTVRDGNISGRITEVDASQERLYICPATSTAPDLTVSFGDAQYRPVMTIVEPSEVVSPVAFTSGTFENGQVGFGCLSITNYIGPFHVSFQGVLMAEIPCDDAILPTGYFASSYFTGALTHTYNAGAGGLLAIKQDNYWRRDDAGRDGVITNWSPGVLVWKIPIGWKRLRYLGDTLIFADKPDYEFHTNTNSRPLLIGGRGDVYTQTFRIEPDGTAVIEKFGWRLSRSRSSESGTVEKIE